MQHRDFHIGQEFWCGGKRWRCTDIGIRVIVAISLEPHEVVCIDHDTIDSTKRIKRRYITDDPNWLIGPPYKIVEEVFDEYAIEGCNLTNDE